MLRTCDGTDTLLVGPAGGPCNCELTFDDVELTVIYPHTAILSRSEKNDLWDKVQAAVGVPYVWGSGPPTERSTTE